MLARVADGMEEFTGAEEAVKTFYEHNRAWQDAWTTVLEAARLRRRVDISEEVYVTLRGDAETARIDEVDNVPVITVIDPAVPPEERTAPQRTLIVLVAFALGCSLAIVWVTGAEYVRRTRHIRDLRAATGGGGPA